MITEKTYLKALKVVQDYERQLQQANVKGQFKILLADISFNIYGFHCQKIKHLTQEQHQKLSDELSKIGKSVLWTNTEEMDYLCVAWIGTDGCYSPKERESICKILNCL